MRRVNLFIIGINKAGTSWLHYMLDQHPSIYMSETKELYFFGDDGPGPPNRDAYHRHFPFEDEYKYYGESTPMYHRDEAVSESIYQYNSAAKILAIVRDPIQRLLSQYRYHKQLGILEESTTVEEALDGRDQKLLRDSHYEGTLPAFANQFGPDQFQLVSLEKGRDHLQDCWHQLLSFLNLPSAPCPNPDAKPENPTGSPAFRRLYRATVRPIKNHAPAFYQWMLQSTFIRQIKRGSLQLLGTADAEALSPDMKTRLRDEFAPTYTYLREQGFDIYDKLEPDSV